MYDPKDVLTTSGYMNHITHIQNIENGLFWLENNADDLHIGSMDSQQEKDFYELLSLFVKLKPVLMTGDGEVDEN